MKNKTLSSYICDNDKRMWRIMDFAIEYHREHNREEDVIQTMKIKDKIITDIEDLCGEIARLRAENRNLENLLNIDDIPGTWIPMRNEWYERGNGSSLILYYSSCCQKCYGVRRYKHCPECGRKMEV